MRILEQLLRRKGSLTTLLERIAGDQGAEDKAFIQALCFGVCRHYQRLDFICSSLLKKPLRGKDADLHALLLTGLYQLQFMRVPAHAAVSETVALTRPLKKPWAKNLVNAILREAQRSRARFDEAIEQDDTLRYSHPEWMIAAFRRDWPRHWREILTAGNERAPLTLRIDLRRSGRDDYLAVLADAGLTGRAGRLAATAVVLEEPVPVTRLPGFAEGLVSVQDEAAQLAAPLLAPEPGQRVLDGCAAPGGKTCAMLEAAPGIDLLAVDNDPARLDKVRDNLDRGGLHARLEAADLLDVETWWDGVPFDRILLDVPCSGTGVIRRHPDIKVLRTASEVAELTTRQARMLQRVWPLLAPGGRLLYSTCSVLSPENSGRIAQFLSATPDVREVSLDVPGSIPCDHGCQLLPGAANHDGFYYALLEKY